MITLGMAAIALIGALQNPVAVNHTASLTTAVKKQVIDSAVTIMNDRYIFADVAKRMETAVKAKFTNGDYDSVTDPKDFATKLTADLQAVSKDKHLRVRYNPDGFPPDDNRKPTKDDIAAEKDFYRILNHGFEAVKRLQGNIGLLELGGFMNPKEGKDTVASAMSFLKGTDAIIVDLRQNGGGDPAMVALICSYFFKDKVHLNDLYFRKENTTEQFWTNPGAAKVKFIEQPVYVLTSKYTFSGAEEFTYNMQTQKRATIIGETTGGGAHPGEFVQVADKFGMFIPTGRAINPITKTNWEGVGVKPDIECPADQALKQAHLLASKKLLQTVKNDMQKNGLQDNIKRLEQELSGGK